MQSFIGPPLIFPSLSLSYSDDLSVPLDTRQQLHPHRPAVAELREARRQTVHSVARGGARCVHGNLLGAWAHKR